MSRSHHNSQPPNHLSHHQNSWFMSPNIVNNLFCSPGNSGSANCNNAFINTSNASNHLTNLLNNQHHFISPTPLSHHPPPSPLAGNQPFSSHYHGSHQSFNSQAYSSMFPPMNAHSSSINIGSSGRLIVGQNNHHYQNQSNHPRAVHSNRISRMNPGFSIDVNQSCKYPPSYNSNEQVLSLPTYTFSEKSSDHGHFDKNVKSQSNQFQKQNNEKEKSKTTTKQVPNSRQHSVKGMENIKLDNEGVRSNYNPLAGSISQKSSFEYKNNSADNDSNFGNLSTEYIIQNSKSSDTDEKLQKNPVKFTLSLNVEEDEYVFVNNEIVDVSKPTLETESRKQTGSELGHKIPAKVERISNHIESMDKVVNSEKNAECEEIIILKTSSKPNNQTGAEIFSSVQNPSHAKSCSSNMDSSGNDPNFMWTPHNQSFSNFGTANLQSGLVNQFAANSAHYTMASPNYVSVPQQTANNFTATFMASSLNGAHPSSFTNMGHKCTLYKQDNSFASTYHDLSSNKLWQYYITNRQTEAMYVRKVQLRNALHMVMSYVFENAGLFIVGSSMNGFGSDSSDMDLCLTITSKDLHQKKEAFVVLNQLVEPLRKCSFIKNLQLIRATVPILKFRDTLAGVDCDLNINNVVGIYNTHLLAMYNRIDWRLRPLGMYIKHWAQKVDLHDASRGRLSTYTLILMLIQYLQAGCNPPVLPCLQSAFPKQFSYDRQVKEVDMRLDLPWDELRSTNTMKLSDLLMGFFEYYVDKFDFSKMAVSIRTGKPIAIEAAIKQLAPHEQLHNVKSFKLFIEEPFSLTNVSRSLFDGLVFSRIKRCFRHSLQVMRLKQSLKMMFTLPTPTEGTSSATDCSETGASLSNHEDNSKTLPLSDSNDISEKSDISCLEDDDVHLTSNKSDERHCENVNEVETLCIFDNT